MFLTATWPSPERQQKGQAAREAAEQAAEGAPTPVPTHMTSQEPHGKRALSKPSHSLDAKLPFKHEVCTHTKPAA
jgi:hypothetical protein